MEHREGVGRVLVAARALEAWERVVEDEAVVVGPTDTPVCLGCLAVLEGGGVGCGGCGGPVCGEECAGAPPHHLLYCRCSSPPSGVQGVGEGWLPPW